MMVQQQTITDVHHSMRKALRMNWNRREMLAGGLGMAGAVMLTGSAHAEQQDPKLPLEAIVLIAQIKAKEDQLAAVKKALLAMVPPTRKERGCICYNLHEGKSDKTVFTFYEQWVDQAAFDAHSESPHMQRMRKAIDGKTEKVEVTFLEYLPQA